MSSTSYVTRILNILGQFKRLIQVWDELHKADNLIADSRENANAITLEMDKFKDRVLKIGKKLLNEQNEKLTAFELRQKLKQRSFVKNKTEFLYEINECKHLYLQLKARISLIKFKIDYKIVTLDGILKAMNPQATTQTDLNQTKKYLTGIGFNLSDFSLLTNIVWDISSGIYGLYAAVRSYFKFNLTKQRINEIAVEFGLLQKLDLHLSGPYEEITQLQVLLDELFNSPNVCHTEAFYDDIINRMITFHTGYRLALTM